MGSKKELVERLDTLISLLEARHSEPELLRAKVTIEDIANNLQVSKSTAKRYTDDKKFPAPCKGATYRVGNQFRETDKRWFTDEVNAWFNRIR